MYNVRPQYPVRVIEQCGQASTKHLKLGKHIVHYKEQQQAVYYNYVIFEFLGKLVVVHKYKHSNAESVKNSK